MDYLEDREKKIHVLLFIMLHLCSCLSYLSVNFLICSVPWAVSGKLLFSVLSLSLFWLSCDLMNCSLPGSSVHRISQAGILEWFAVSFSRWSSQPKGWTHITWIALGLFTCWTTREAQQIVEKKWKWIFVGWKITGKTIRTWGMESFFRIWDFLITEQFYDQHAGIPALGRANSCPEWCNKESFKDLFSW